MWSLVGEDVDLNFPFFIAWGGERGVEKEEEAPDQRDSSN